MEAKRGCAVKVPLLAKVALDVVSRGYGITDELGEEVSSFDEHLKMFCIVEAGDDFAFLSAYGRRKRILAELWFDNPSIGAVQGIWVMKVRNERNFQKMQDLARDLSEAYGKDIQILADCPPLGSIAPIMIPGL